MVYHIPSVEYKVNKTRERFQVSVIRVSRCQCVCSMRAVFGVVKTRGYGFHGKESTKGDMVHHKKRGIGLVGISEAPRLQLECSTAGSVNSQQRTDVVFAIVCTYVVPSVTYSYCNSLMAVGS